MSPAEAYRVGTQAFSAGQFEVALRHLRSIRQAQALHLAAVSAQKLNQLNVAADLFRQALNLGPNDPNIANNYGHFALAQSDHELALRLFESALKQAPNLAAALIGVAKVHTAQTHWEKAIPAWRKVLAVSPASATGRYGLATALLETGEVEEAEALFQALLQEKASPALLFMLGRTHLEQNRLESAEQFFAASFSQDPTDYALRNLANLYWMQGATDKFSTLTENAPAALRHESIRLVLESGDIDRADAIWRAAYASGAPDKAAWLLKAAIAREAQDAEHLGQATDQALRQDPTDLVALDLRIVADLMRGEPDLALTRLKPLRQAQPDAQHWLAHEFVALRMLGQASELLDLDRYVRAYDLPPPDGFDTIEAFNASFVETLQELHCFSARPLNQSLRGQGTQTTRSLTSYDHPVIQAYIDALGTPIQKYLADIGQAPSHPTSARNQGTYSFAGMWSVRLRGQGFHESHVHPNGWISSAYYVAVPPGTDQAADRAGWIGFGAPPYRVPTDSSELKWIAPKAGRVVLFPSFMWHGTKPIKDDAERITAPFDLIP
jgi:tetratricopeptide (TPR) repeat protein